MEGMKTYHGDTEKGELATNKRECARIKNPVTPDAYSKRRKGNES
jgi:hypothetical protein